MAKSDYKSTMSQLGAKLKDEPVKTPMQEVRPVEASIPSSTESEQPKKDAHVNFWVAEDLMERLKIHAARSRKTIKQIGIEAFEEYLAKRR